MIKKRVTIMIFAIMITAYGLVAYTFCSMFQLINISGIIKVDMKDFERGDGTIDNPYEISNERHLSNAVRYWRNNYASLVFFKQVADIYITQDWNGTALGNFFPFGLLDANKPHLPESYSPFKGLYDGGGYKISGLDIQNLEYAALFASAENAKLTNIHILESSFSAISISAAIVANVNNSTINLCSSNATISSQDLAAGLIGKIYSSVIVQENYNSGMVNGKKAAGIVSETGVFSEISDVYNVGTINGTLWASGIGGQISANTIAKNIVSIGKVSNPSQKTYALFANDNPVAIQASYYFANFSGNDFYPLTGVDNALSRYDTQLRNKGNFAFTDVNLWMAGMKEHQEQYPFIQLARNPYIYENPNDHYMHGDGTASFPYQINFENQLRLVGSKNDQVDARLKPYRLNSNYSLQEDIELQESWTPIGTYEDDFNGVFNGNGHRITNLSINLEDADDLGFFGCLHSALILNLNIEEAEVNGNVWIGIMAGLALSSRITNCSVSGKVKASNTAGGLVGFVDGTDMLIQDCSSSGTVTGSHYMGGLVGRLAMGTIKNSFSISELIVFGNEINFAGGLIGSNERDGNISNCYASGNIGKGYMSGGFVGSNRGNISNCYSIGNIAQYSNNGGFAASSTGTITNCFWDTTTSGMIYSNGGVGRNTEQMKTPATYTGWSADIWLLREGQYPKLLNIQEKTNSLALKGVINND